MAAWVGFASAGQCAAQALDRNDPAAVLRAVRAALGPDAQLVAGSAGCITTPFHFPELVIVRIATPASGCQLVGVLRQGSLERGEEQGGLLERIGQEALIARGWIAANGEARRTMAEQWVIEVLFSEDAVLDPLALPADLRRDAATPPQSRILPDGEIEVRLWTTLTTIAGTQLAPATVTFTAGAQISQPIRAQPVR
jgi:hypothetical protein